MFKTLQNLLIPHRGNNHRAKILHNSSLIVIIVLFLVGSFAIHFLKTTRPAVLGISYSISEGDLINLTNSDRAANGLSALSENAKLDDAARRKASDMFAKNYWAHFAPDGSTSPWTFIRDAGYSYTYAGENLAKGFTDASSIESAWMNSPTHRENLLSGNFRDVGYAIVEGNLQGEDTVLVVQMFGSQNSNTGSTISPQAQVTSVPTPAQQEVKAVVANIASETTPTVIPTVTPTIVKSNTNVTTAPLIDSKNATKAISIAGLILIIAVLIIDIIIIEKKKIPRLVGHNIDHILLISLFILFILLSVGGSIL